MFYFIGFIFVNSANASIFNSMINWLKGNDKAPDQSANSQTVPLLQAPLNTNPSSAVGGGDITIVGQSALLPDIGPLGSVADIKDKPPSDQISIYVVRGGDNLAGIAKMFGVSVNTILWANNLGRSDVIKVGQTLVILPVSGIQYVVKSGDTIQSIAKKWKGNGDEIIQFNDLSANSPLVVGSTIIIPDGEAPIAVSSNTSSGTFRGGSGPYYAGYYIRPITGGHKSQTRHGYNAVDLANSCGTPIVAAASGDVLMARSGGWNGGYGNFLIIDHSNGTQTLYAHMLSIIVDTGWHVVQGQVIGYIGVTGNTTGCHLHFEVRGATNPF